MLIEKTAAEGPAPPGPLLYTPASIVKLDMV